MKKPAPNGSDGKQRGQIEGNVKGTKKRAVVACSEITALPGLLFISEIDLLQPTHLSQMSFAVRTNGQRLLLSNELVRLRLLPCWWRKVLLCFYKSYGGGRLTPTAEKN